MIRPALAADLAEVARLTAVAMHDDPFSRALVPEPPDRARRLPGYFGELAGHAVACGVVDLATAGDRIAGCAIWIAGEALGTLSHARLRELAGGGEHFDRLADALDGVHPAEPHWYLAVLAVAPDHQRRGLGTALLRHRLAALPGAAYSEATSEDSVRLHARHGFVAHGPAVSVGTGDIQPMWRSVRRAAAPPRGPSRRRP